MKKTIHRFKTSEEFANIYYDNGKYYKPWVGSIVNNLNTSYNKDDRDYLTFEILTDGNIKFKCNDNEKALTIEYSMNDTYIWNEITSSTDGAFISVVSGDKVKVRGNNKCYYDGLNTFNGTTAEFNLSGNLTSLYTRYAFEEKAQLLKLMHFLHYLEVQK